MSGRMFDGGGESGMTRLNGLIKMMPVGRERNSTIVVYRQAVDRGFVACGLVWWRGARTMSTGLFVSPDYVSYSTGATDL